MGNGGGVDHKEREGRVGLESCKAAEAGREREMSRIVEGVEAG
jgi:hypothetical protein